MIKIIQGGAISFIIRIKDVSTGEPLSLSGVTTLSTCFANADATELMLGLGTGITITNATLGKITISLTSAQTTLLASTQSATLQLNIVYGTDDPIILQSPDAYQIVQSVC